jgi:uncharacterized protein (DUF362 family)
MSINRRDFLQVSGAGAALVIAGSPIIKNSAFAAEASGQKASDISFVGSSSSGTRKKMILDVLEPWRTRVSDGIKGKTIIIKPNVISSTYALTSTQVDAVRGTIEFLRSITAQPIIIAESAGGGVLSGFKNYGYNSLTTEFKDVTLVDLDNTTLFAKKGLHIWKPDLSSTNSINIHGIFADPKYYVISVCRPKTHNCMVITGVCKNILMGAPQVSHKQMMHGGNGWSSGTNKGEDKCLAYNMYQLGNIIYPSGAVALSVLDAWEGMEGNGPISGTSIMQYCAVAGTDSLAVDRLCSKLMGFSDTATEPMNKNNPSYTDARALWWLSNAGIGNYDLNRINFILGSLTEVDKYVKKYKLSDLYTGNTSYQTNWTGGAPSTILDKPVTSVYNEHFLDPKPFLFPQINNSAGHQIKINFTLPVGYAITMSIFNLKGVEIRSLAKEYLNPGKYSIEWDRRDNYGSYVPSGSYIIKMGFNDRFISNQLSLI